MIYLLILLLIILGILIYSGYYFSKIILYPNVHKYDETFDTEIKNGNLNKEYFINLKKEEIFIDSDFGYKLHAIYFPNGESKKTVVICHGYTSSLFGSIKYMKIYYKRGFNVLIYDHRYHGKSGGENCTFGYYEKYDLKKVIDFIEKRAGEGFIIGTHGESMGASVVLLHAAIDSRIKFVIADCPYESVKEQFKHRLKVEYKLRAFPILNMASIFTKIKTKAFLEDIAPLSIIDKVQIPVFFIHGDSDNYIPYSHSIKLYNKKNGVKMLYIAKGAEHAKSYSVDKGEYENKVNEFLEKIEIL